MKPRVAGLHLQLLGLIILPLAIVVLVVAVLGIQIHQGAMRQLVAERDERSVRAAATAISQQLHHLESAALSMALHLDSAIAPSQVLERFAYLQPDFDIGPLILDAEGQVLASDSSFELTDEFPLMALLEQSAGDNAVSVAPLVTDSGVAYWLAGSGRSGYVIGGLTISKLIQSARLGTVVDSPGSSVYLMDSSGELLGNLGVLALPRDPGGHPGVQAALRGEAGSVYLPASDGEHVVAFSPIPETGWALIIEEPWESVSSPLLDLSLVAPLALTPVLIVALIGIWFGARQVIKPLQELRERADKMQLAETAPLGGPVGGIAEIQSLQQTMILMAKRIRAAQSALQRYIGAITNAQEEERGRLARELHDETIQDMIAVVQKIQMLTMELPSDQEALGVQLHKLHQQVNRAIQEVRRLVRGLRPVYLEDLGLIPSIEMLAADASRESGIRLEVEVVGKHHRLGPANELAIYRIVQEALNNLIHHAQADRAELRIHFEQSEVRVSLRDDGVGFRIPTGDLDLAKQDSFGLISMRERALLVGAELQIESQIGKGTLIQLVLPMR